MKVFTAIELFFERQSDQTESVCSDPKADILHGLMHRVDKTSPSLSPQGAMLFAFPWTVAGDVDNSGRKKFHEFYVQVCPTKIRIKKIRRVLLIPLRKMKINLLNINNMKKMQT